MLCGIVFGSVAGDMDIKKFPTVIIAGKFEHSTLLVQALTDHTHTPHSDVLCFIRVESRFILDKWLHIVCNFLNNVVRDRFWFCCWWHGPPKIYTVKLHIYLFTLVHLFVHVYTIHVVTWMYVLHVHQQTSTTTPFPFLLLFHHHLHHLLLLYHHHWCHSLLLSTKILDVSHHVVWCRLHRHDSCFPRILVDRRANKVFSFDRCLSHTKFKSSW